MSDFSINPAWPILSNNTVIIIFALLVKNILESMNQLEIKNFKSIKHAKFDTSRVNIFIGKPNSGKSNLLEAMTLFNFVQDKALRQNEPTIIRYNTLDNLFYDRNLSNDVEISFSQNQAVVSYYSTINTFLHIINPSSEYLRERDNFKQELSINDILSTKVLNQPDSGKYHAKIAILDQNGRSSNQGGILSENPVRRYEFKDRTSYGDSFSAYLKTYGENLFTIVQGSPELREWISSFYDEYNLEFLMDFSSRIFEIQKKQKGIVYKIPFELTPDTFRRMLFHIAAIYSNKNATILLEEPESHSFPPYIKELSELIKEDKNNTYFITTHSPYFFNSMVEDSKTIEDISFFYVYYDDFQTKIKKLNQEDLDIIWQNGVDVFFNIASLSK